MARCRLCGGPLGLLGTLGLMKHYQCRDCGMAYTKEGKPKARPVKIKSTKSVRP